MKYRKLNNGIEMPILGLGTDLIPEEKFDEVVNTALDAGYRMFDTAQKYNNEEYLGAALAKQTKVKRSELFITTKIWPCDFGYEETKKAVQGSLKRLQTNYLDLVLIHWPYNNYYGAWKALQEFVEKGIIKSIGVSNFTPEQIEDLIIWNKIKPVINQIEMHPLYQRQEEIDFLNSKDVAIGSWSSFARNAADLFTNPVLVKIADKYNKKVPQIILKWLVQRNITVIPKSQTPKNIKANIDIFDFELDKQDLEQIAILDKGKPLFPTTMDVNNVDLKFRVRPKYDKQID